MILRPSAPAEPRLGLLDSLNDMLAKAGLSHGRVDIVLAPTICGEAL